MEPTPEEQYHTSQTPFFELDKNEFLIEGTNVNGERLFIDGIEIWPDDSQKIRNHSPDGFAWGYTGSGPAQTALAICLHIFKNRYVAEALYQDFKEVFVAAWQPVGSPFREKIDMANFLIDHHDRLQTALEWEEWEKEKQELMRQEQADEEIEFSQTEEDKAIEQQMRNALKQITAEQRTVNRLWLVGDLVTIRHPDLGGVKALVYQLYERGPNSYGISLITQDGRNLGGWEPDSWKFLDFDHATGLVYDFESVGQLMTDFDKGVFTPYFEIL